MEKPTPEPAEAPAPATAVNPFAGWHPVTSDPGEAAAVQRATEAILRDFPYYEQRYGGRARLFGQSDGGWLATLHGYGPEQLREQVLWLGRVLASRGMPRYLLERYLAVLHAELSGARPDAAARHDGLLAAASLLAAERRRHLPDDALRELADAFDERVGPSLAGRHPRTGDLLAAAAADEAAGIAGAVPSLLEWAADAERFPTEWLHAVHLTVQRARERCAAPDE